MSPTGQSSSAQTKPRRRVGLLGAISTIVGFVVGASIFVLPGPVAGTVGPGLPFAYLLAVIPAIFTCLYLVQLGSVLPVTGSNYIVASRFGSPLAGFSVVWMFIACAAFALPVMAIGFASYLQTLFPSANIKLTAVLVVLALGALNLFGIKAVTIVQTMMTGIFIAALLMFILGGLPNVDPGNYVNLFPNGLNGLFLGAITVYFSFTGFTVIAEIAGEVKNARRTIPLALTIALTIVLLVYLAVGAVVTGTLHWQEAGQSAAAVAESASLFYPTEVVTLISVGALFASATTINALFASVARDIFRLGEDQVFPRWFAKVSPHQGAPYPGILVITALALMAILLDLDIEQYSMLTVFAFLLLQCIGAVAVFRVRVISQDLWKKAPIRYNSLWRNITLIGLIATSLMVFVFATYKEPMTAGLFLVVLIVGYFMWAARSAALKRHGVELKQATQGITKSISRELEESFPSNSLRKISEPTGSARAQSTDRASGQ